MATEETQQTPKLRPKKKTSCFSSCFCFPVKMSDSGNNRSPGNMGSTKFSWSRFQKKKSGRKTVPEDIPIVEKPTNSVRESKFDSNIVDEIEEIDEKFVGKCQIPGDVVRQQARVPEKSISVSDQGAHEKTRKANHGIREIQREIQLVKSPKSEDSLISVHSDRWDNLAAVIHKTGSQPGFSEKPVRSTSYPPLGSRKPEEKRAVDKKPGSEPGSPNKTQVGSTFSSLPGRRRKQAQRHGISRLSSEKTRQETDTRTGKYGPLAGMSALVVALGVTLLLGRVYAIVLTSVWFYFIPWFRTGEKPGEVAGNERGSVVEIDLNSAEYKKRVILEGLLERKRRNRAVVL